MKIILRTKFFIKISILLLGCLFLVDSELKSQSIDESELNSITQKAEQIERVRTLIIHQNGETLTKKSFNERDLNHPFNIKSASKSIIGLLTGIAIENGFIPSIEEPIKTYFPEYFEDNPDSIKESITIRNLLTMQTGLRSTSSGNYGAWVISDNWVEYALDQDFVSQIDGRMVYSTGTSHLLSVIISKASGMSTKAFAEKYLFGPMNIRVGGWDKDPQGNYMGGNNLALKPADLLKIGQLMLDNGRYDDEQLISKDWVSDSFGTYTYSNYNPYGYGYQWWNQTIGGYKTFFAWGSGGQYIFIIPELETVVVITSSTATTDRSRSYKTPVFELVQFDIIPFLEARIN
jgi:CubicO group peptidase (beta-lactamase class C family)